MAALRWFFFSLLCFGGGAVAAFAMHPPQLGIPDASAADLRERLAKIESYAAAGRCKAVEGQILGAKSTLDKLPENTAVTVQQQLQDAVEKVRQEASSRCLEVAATRTNTATATATATVAPTETPEPTSTPQATPTPDIGDGGAPDPGSGEGTATPPAGDDQGGGGVTIPQGDAGAALRQGFQHARERAEQALDDLQRGGR